MTDTDLRQEVVERVRRRGVYGRPGAAGDESDAGFVPWFRATSGAEEALAAVLASAAADEDWALFERSVIAATSVPSAVYLEPLCDVLDRRAECVNVEDVVDLLGRIASPQAVTSLERALWWQPSWDEFHGLGIKCIWALSEIGTASARVVVADAASTGPEEVRRWARSALERWP